MDAKPPLSITCPGCGMASHHPDDVREGCCGNCYTFREELMEVFGIPEELRVKWRAIGGGQ